MNKVHHFYTNDMFVTVVERDDNKLAYLIKHPDRTMKRVIGNKVDNFVAKICNRIQQISNETVKYAVSDSIWLELYK